jgi:hypothetical protein
MGPTAGLEPATSLLQNPIVTSDFRESNTRSSTRERLGGIRGVPKNDIYEDYMRYAEHCLKMVAAITDQESRCIQREMAAEWLRPMKKRGLFAFVLGAAILCATPLSLQRSSNTMPSLSFDRADAQNRVAGVNRRIGAYGPNYAGNPYVNYRHVNPYVNHGNPYVNPYANRR